MNSTFKYIQLLEHRLLVKDRVLASARREVQALREANDHWKTKCRALEAHWKTKCRALEAQAHAEAKHAAAQLTAVRAEVKHEAHLRGSRFQLLYKLHQMLRDLPDRSPGPIYPPIPVAWSTVIEAWSTVIEARDALREWHKQWLEAPTMHDLRV